MTRRFIFRSNAISGQQLFYFGTLLRAINALLIRDSLVYPFSIMRFLCIASAVFRGLASKGK